MDAIRPSNIQKCTVLLLFRQFSAWLDNLSQYLGPDINPQNLLLADLKVIPVLRIAAVLLLLLWVLGF